MSEMAVLLGFKTTDKTPRYRARAERCLATWLAAAPAVYDFRPLSNRDYYNLGRLTQEVCRVGLVRGFSKVLMTDDDIFIRWPLDIPAAEYAGLVAPPSGGQSHAYCRGACYWLGREAMRVLVNAEMDDGMEDRWVGKVLARAGIAPIGLPGYYLSPCECGNSFCRPDSVPADWRVLMELDRWPGAWERAAARGKIALG